MNIKLHVNIPFDAKLILEGYRPISTRLIFKLQTPIIHFTVAK
jgi:hypothetical protein